MMGRTSGGVFELVFWAWSARINGWVCTTLVASRMASRESGEVLSDVGRSQGVKIVTMKNGLWGQVRA